MRLATLAVTVTIHTQAEPEFGKLNNADWWANATTADVNSKMAKYKPQWSVCFYQKEQIRNLATNMLEH